MKLSINRDFVFERLFQMSFKFKIEIRRMAIANGTCVSFCNQPKAHFGLTWERAPGTIAKNVTWTKRGFSADQTHKSIYPSIFNRFLCTV